MSEETTAMEPTRYSEIAPKDEVDAIKAEVLRLSAGGFKATVNGSSREMTNAERFATAIVATRYGLDPFLGDMFMLGDRPYVSIMGQKRFAHRSGRLSRPWCVLPASTEERAMMHVHDNEELWKAEVWVDGGEIPWIGWGRADAKNVPISRGDHRIIANLAEKRALARAFRDVFMIDAYDPSDVAQFQAATNVEHTPLTKSATVRLPPTVPAALPEPTPEVLDVEAVKTPSQQDAKPAPVAVPPAVTAKAPADVAEKSVAAPEETVAGLTVAQAKRVRWIVGLPAKKKDKWGAHIGLMIDAGNAAIEAGYDGEEATTVLERLCKAGENGASPGAILRQPEIYRVLEAGGLDAKAAVSMVVTHAEQDEAARIDLLIAVDNLSDEDAGLVLISARQTKDPIPAIRKALAQLEGK